MGSDSSLPDRAILDLGSRSPTPPRKNTFVKTRMSRSNNGHRRPTPLRSGTAAAARETAVAGGGRRRFSTALYLDPLVGRAITSIRR